MPISESVKARGIFLDAKDQANKIGQKTQKTKNKIPAHKRQISVRKTVKITTVLTHAPANLLANPAEKFCAQIFTSSPTLAIFPPVLFHGLIMVLSNVGTGKK